MSRRTAVRPDLPDHRASHGAHSAADKKLLRVQSHQTELVLPRSQLVHDLVSHLVRLGSSANDALHPDGGSQTPPSLASANEEVSGKQRLDPSTFWISA